MNSEDHSFSSNKSTSLNPIQVNLDEFNISENSFKPMTKGLGFHQDQKRPSFKPAPKEVKVFGSSKTLPKAVSNLSPLSPKLNVVTQNHTPSGLEAFYGTKGSTGSQTNILELTASEDMSEKIVTRTQFATASGMIQFFAWIIDVLVVTSFVVITGTLLVFASGIHYQMLAKLISTQDLIAFSLAIFSIYYLLYFTILDLSASPGKTIMGIRLLRIDNSNVTVKNTFARSFISLVSSIALFLPMLLDFQGRLSDTKVVK